MLEAVDNAEVDGDEAVIERMTQRWEPGTCHYPTRPKVLESWEQRAQADAPTIRGRHLHAGQAVASSPRNPNLNHLPTHQCHPAAHHERRCLDSPHARESCRAFLDHRAHTLLHRCSRSPRYPTASHRAAHPADLHHHHSRGAVIERHTTSLASTSTACRDILFASCSSIQILHKIS